MPFYGSGGVGLTQDAADLLYEPINRCPFIVGTGFVDFDGNAAPETTWPGTTWTKVGLGKTLVGLNAGDPEFASIGQTGGAKTHTLTAAEMPAHTHAQDPHTHTQNSHNHTQDAHSHTYASQTATTGGASSYEHGAIDTSSTAAESSISTNAATATNQAATATNQNATATNQSTGGGGAHNNLQPYVVVYFWKRTA